MISILLVEDECMAREHLAGYIQEREDVQLRDIAVNGQEALDMLREKRHQLVFLDLNLPLLTGIQVLDEAGSFPFIIFTSVSRNGILRTKDGDGLEYLAKPIEKKAFERTLLRAIDDIRDCRNPESRNNGIITLDTIGPLLLPWNEVVYLHSQGSKVIVHGREKSFEVPRPLGKLKSTLEKNNIIQLNENLFVNPDFIGRVKGMLSSNKKIVLKDAFQTELPASASFLKARGAGQYSQYNKS